LVGFRESRSDVTDTVRTWRVPRTRSEQGDILKTSVNTGINLAAPQGFEPRYADPESAVLPLNEGAATSED
jgi:hypothetical protein